jgi:hypothetical protein
MNLEQLIHLNIELEGLLRVVNERDNEQAKQLLFAKYNDFKDLFEKTFIGLQSDIISEHTEQIIADSVDTKYSNNQEQNKESEQNTESKSIETLSKAEIANEDKPQLLQTEKEVTTVEDVVANRQNEMRLDEMLTRREARDIRKAFTLNDKFRFRRELFANNDAQFAETLNLLSAMQNLDEAIEYLRDDLGWDMDNDDVKDFVNIVNNHFASV